MPQAFVSGSLFLASMNSSLIVCCAVVMTDSYDPAREKMLSTLSAYPALLKSPLPHALSPKPQNMTRSSAWDACSAETQPITM